MHKFNFNLNLNFLFHIGLIRLLSSFNLLDSVMTFWLSCHLHFGVISFSSWYPCTKFYIIYVFLWNHLLLCALGKPGVSQVGFSPKLFRWMTVGYITLIHVKSKPVSIGFPCHLGSSGILPHLLWQKAPQVLCPICQPHVGVSDNNILLIWLCGLTLRQSNAIQRVFYRTVSVLKWVSVCVYTNICMFAYICNF